jgi:hypothetical protein
MNKHTLHALAAMAFAMGSAACITPVMAQTETAATASDPRYASDAAVASIRVTALPGQLIADGRSVLRFTVSITGKDGAPVKSGFVAVSADGGILLDADGHPASAGLSSLPFANGNAEFALLAPATPGDVHVRVASGGVHADGTLNYLPELRDMVAIGVVEGVISKHHLNAGSIAPTGFEDGFEQEIQRWSRNLSSNVNGAGRLAFFLKGKISGDALLTAAYDSDKDTRLKLAKTIDPNAVYPVYGDNAITGFEAQSADRLYVRVDKDKSYLLYGDFATAGPQAQASSLSLQSASTTQPMLLGRYNRSANGLRGHYEEAGKQLDGFVISDSLKQVIEEYPANGTSGPFAVRNSNAVQNSERVEVLVRDKNQRGVIKNVTPLVRFVDYSFEPFSGRILLNQSLPSLAPSGDPVSLRITYEVDQGGERFLTLGASASGQVNDKLRLGVSGVDDKNPLAPYRLSSANADLRLNDKWRVVVEAAHTRSTLYTANGQTFALPSNQSGETGTQTDGDAGRIEASYKDGGVEGRLWWVRADAGFNNANSGIAPGREDSGARASVQVDDATRAYGELARSHDATTQTGRQAERIGVARKLSESVTVDLSLRHLQDNSAFPSDAAIGGNAAPLGADGTGSGGFFGTGTFGSGNFGTVIDPLTGMPVTSLAPVGNTTTPPTTPAAGQNLEATTVRAGVTWQATPELLVDAGVEKSVNGEDHSSAELGAAYAVNAREKLYARAETQTGLASANSLIHADRSTSFVAGMSHGVSEETSLFSEFRMVDAQQTNPAADNPASYDRLLANGLKNMQAVAQGVVVTSTAEYLHVFNGDQRKGLALGSGVSYSAHPDWRATAKLEYRRLFDSASLPGNQTQDQWLATVTLARKLDDDWTLLLKNYLLTQFNRDDAAGAAMGDSHQERFLAGFAWRPVDNNKVNALARYEFKSIDDKSQPLGEQYEAHIASAVMDYHPRRDWWTTGRVAFKHRVDFGIPGGDQAYNAWLLGGRLTYDVSERIDIGFVASTLRQTSGSASETAYGVEAGYRAATNLWVSLGYNRRGFTDRDLAASDYTSRGIFLRLRAKFDEGVFAH